MVDRALEVLAMLDVRTARMLVVDDSRTTRRIVTSMIHGFGIWQVDEACDGAEALDLLDRRHYSLLISDWRMAPMSGFELLIAVRANPKTRGLPFLMITAENDYGEIINAKSAGATSYLMKPFTMETLNAKLSRFVEARPAA
ncbi:response regulator [Sphingomonas sp.]|uniref:response regulator n=1 Tax=Sphingomonas sp. TaxID=28214 RepID=UPI0025ED6FBC|nr:response regulator [Sphingomonas sp.]